MSNKIRVSQSGSGAPTSVTPDFIGEFYLNETNGDVYKAFGTSSGNWYKIPVLDASGNLSATNLSGTNTGDQTNVNGSSGSCTGNAATATKLAATKNINGVAFDGSADITIATGAIPVTSIAVSTTAAVNNAYVITGGTTIVTLPAVCAVGDKVIVTNQGNLVPTSAKIVPATGDTIGRVTYGYNDVDSTGYIALQKYSTIELVCVVANTTWLMLSGSGGYSVKYNSTATSEYSDITRGIGYNVVKPLTLAVDTTLDGSNTSSSGITVIKANKGTLLVLTLSGSDSYAGQIVKVIGVGAGGWKIAQGATSCQIFFGSKATTSGTGGYLQSTEAHNCIELYCNECDGMSSQWTVISSVGNITIV